MLLITVIFAFIFGVGLVCALAYGGMQVPGMLMKRKLDARLLGAEAEIVAQRQPKSADEADI